MQADRAADAALAALSAKIRDVPNFPKEGILFKDITTLLMDPAAFREAVDLMAATYRGSDGAVRLYVDGTEVGEGTTPGVKIAYNLPTSNDLVIGDYAGGPGHNFNGLIDEPAIFNRALSAQEVHNHFAAGSQGAKDLKHLVRVREKPSSTQKGVPIAFQDGERGVERELGQSIVVQRHGASWADRPPLQPAPNADRAKRE